jgi:hypothetical protein
VAAQLGDLLPRTNAAFTLVDQICSSGSNFALLVIIAQSTKPADFGIFAILFGILTVGLGTGRAALGVPLGLDLATASERDKRGLLATSTGLALLLSLAVVVLELAAAAITASSGLVWTVVGLAIFTPVVLTQDLWRFSAVAHRRPIHAVVSDGVWLMISGGMLLINLARSRPLSPTVGTFVWCGGAAAALSILVVTREGIRPSFQRVGGALREARRRHLAEDSLAASATPVIVASVVGLNISSSAIAAVRGAATLMSPINILLSAVPLGVLPAAARFGPARAPAFIRRVSAVLVAVTLVWGAGLLTLPDSWGRAILGGTWTSAHSLLFFTTAEYVGISLWTGAITLLRVRQRTRPALALRLVYAGTSIVAVGIATAMIRQPVAASAALAATAAGAAVFSWWYAVRLQTSASRVHETVGR